MGNFLVRYTSRVVIYNRRAIIKLAAGGVGQVRLTSAGLDIASIAKVFHPSQTV